MPTLAFARLSPPVDFGAKDGPADLAFLIAAPAGGDATHLQMLTKLARALVKPDFTDALRAAAEAEVVVVAWSAVELGLRPGRAGSTPAAAAPPAPPPPRRPRRPPPSGRPRPAGAASSSPSPRARPASPTPTWRPRRSRPPPSAPASTSRRDPGLGRLDPARRTTTIAGADAVIFATDVGVKDRGRFAGKPVVASGVKRADRRRRRA